MMWSAYLSTWRAMLTDKGALTLLFIGGIIYSFFYPLPYSTEIVQRVPVKIVFQPQDIKAMNGRLVPGMSVIAEVEVNQPNAAQEPAARHAAAPAAPAAQTTAR